MKICIITTYPENGSLNIGDQLISLRACEYIESIFLGLEVEFIFVWRAADWNQVSDLIMASDLVVFACLAIRENMTRDQYPYLWNILNSKKPYLVLGAGTALKPDSDNECFSSISVDSLNALRKINENALTFTTRGLLSQRFCEYHSLDNAVFSGDIAFYDRRFFKSSFLKTKTIKKIAISDPHGGLLYWRPLSYLIDNLSLIFPGAEIICIIHGKNDALVERLKKEGHDYLEIYRDKNFGLDKYNEIDLHVGFRVHGHVSALTRRKPSYLLEQDGRGCDYGLTLNSNVSVPCYLPKGGLRFLSKAARKIGVGFYGSGPGDYPAVKIIAMIKEDARCCFSKFEKLDEQLLRFIYLYDSESKKIFDYFN